MIEATAAAAAVWAAAATVNILKNAYYASK